MRFEYIDKIKTIVSVSKFSIPVWLFIWISFSEFMAWYFFISIPIFIVVLVCSLALLRGPLNFLTIMIWTGPATLVFLIVFANLLSFMLCDHYCYYLGVDVQTPQGIKSGKGMVEVVDNRLPWRILNVFGNGDVKINAEAAFCDLGDGKNIIITLVFKDDHIGKRRLTNLPFGLNTPDEYNTLPPVNQKISIQNEKRPLMVTFTDKTDPMSIKIVNDNNVMSVLGEEYKIDAVWIERTLDEYHHTGIVNYLPWVIQEENGHRIVYAAFRSIGFPAVLRPIIKGNTPN